MTPLEKAIQDLKQALADVRQHSSRNASICSDSDSPIRIQIFSDEAFRELPGEVAVKSHSIDYVYASKTIDGVNLFRLVSTKDLPDCLLNSINKELISRFQSDGR